MLVAEGIPLELYSAHAHKAGAHGSRQLPSVAAAICQKTKTVLASCNLSEEMATILQNSWSGLRGDFPPLVQLVVPLLVQLALLLVTLLATPQDPASHPTGPC